MTATPAELLPVTPAGAVTPVTICTVMRRPRKALKSESRFWTIPGAAALRGFA